GVGVFAAEQHLPDGLRGVELKRRVPGEARSHEILLQRLQGAGIKAVEVAIQIVAVPCLYVGGLPVVPGNELYLRGWAHQVAQMLQQWAAGLAALADCDACAAQNGAKGSGRAGGDIQKRQPLSRRSGAAVIDIAID